MLYKLPLFFFIIFYANTSLSYSKKCQDKFTKIVNEMDEWNKYGIQRTPRGVVEFPKKCTPFMKQNKLVPLPKRQAAGVNRERYLGKDCNVYEWDSQHGAFEVYKPNSNNTAFYHLGENSVVEGVFSDKADAKRNHDFSDTGIPGIKMKDLCKKANTGKLTNNDFKNSKVKNLLNCL